MSQVNASTVIQGYIKLREKRSQLKQEYEAKDNEIKAKMEKLEVYLLSSMQEQNARQLGSEYGTAYIQTTMKASCSDWPSFWGFLRETGRFDMIEKRVSAKSIQTYFEETEQLPPGINTASELKVIIRKN